MQLKDAWKRDLKACEIDPNNWEDAARDRAPWRRTVKEGFENADIKRHHKAEQKRDRGKNSSTLPSSSFIMCNRDCNSRVGLPATQDVAAPPRIDKGTQALSLETSPANTH